MKKKEKEILEDEARRMEEEMQPSGMGELQYEIGPEKKEMKRKDKPAERKNCKRLKLVPLLGWGEHPVEEHNDDIKNWLLKSSHEEH